MIFNCKVYNVAEWMVEFSFAVLCYISDLVMKVSDLPEKSFHSRAFHIFSCFSSQLYTRRFDPGYLLNSPG